MATPVSPEHSSGKMLNEEGLCFVCRASLFSLPAGKKRGMISPSKEEVALCPYRWYAMILLP